MFINKCGILQRMYGKTTMIKMYRSASPSPRVKTPTYASSSSQPADRFFCNTNSLSRGICSRIRGFESGVASCHVEVPWHGHLLGPVLVRMSAQCAVQQMPPMFRLAVLLDAFRITLRTDKGILPESFENHPRICKESLESA